jgi:hypothetical protein
LLWIFIQINNGPKGIYENIFPLIQEPDIITDRFSFL